MKRVFTYFMAVLFIGLISNPALLNAGNEDRSGEAGASELLVNPWARSSGWGSVNTSGVMGVESMYVNIAGASRIPNTELVFGHTTWLKGADVNIYAFGLALKMGESGALTIGAMNMSFGDIPITTVNNPEGGIGTFSPSLMNFSIGYSRAFSNSIYGGLQIKIVSESIADMTGLSDDDLVDFLAYLFQRMFCDFKCPEIQVYSEIYSHYEVYKKLNTED